MSEIIIYSGDYTLNGGSYAVMGANAWYNNQLFYGASPSQNSHSVEISLTLASGEYDVYDWGINSLGGDWWPFTRMVFTDGNSTNSTEIHLKKFLNPGLIDREFTGSYTYNNQQYWKKVAIGVECHTGTLNLFMEPDARGASFGYHTRWYVPQLAIGIRGSLDGTPDTDPEYTPTSNKSKPHPLSTN